MSKTLMSDTKKIIKKKKINQSIIINDNNKEIDLIANETYKINLNKDINGLSDKKTENNIVDKLNKWIEWSDKNKISFLSSDRKNYGNGEEKFGNEFRIKPKGQNSSYDFDYCEYKLEVKQLDNKSFNSGKEGRIKIRKISKIKDTIDTILLFIDMFAEKNDIDYNILINIKKLCEKIIDIGELSESKCKHNGDLDYILNNINNIYVKLLKDTNNVIEAYNLDGKKNKYTYYEYFLLAKMQKYEKNEIISKICNNKYINCEKINLLQNDYIKEPNKLRNEMEESCQIYKNFFLVFVDEKKGYYIMNEPEKKIKFQRITKGHPRFYVNI